MPVSPTNTITRPDPRGTDYEPEPGSPFEARAEYPEYSPLSDIIEEARPAARKKIREGLRQIGIEVLSEPRLSDRNVLYADAVLQERLDELLEAGQITLDDHTLIGAAFMEGTKHAAWAVAAAWLRERGSIPITDATEQSR